MTVEAVRRVTNAQPFLPFIIHLADGRSIPVAHKEFLNGAIGTRTITIYQTDDSYNIIDLLLVTDLEIRPIKTDNSKRRGAPGG